MDIRAFQVVFVPNCGVALWTISFNQFPTPARSSSV